MTRANEELLDRYFKAVESGDIATLDELFADDVVGHAAGRHELAGDYQGKEAVFGFFGRLAELSSGTARLRPRDMLVDDLFAVALVDASGQVGERTIDGEPTVVVFRIADGRIVEWWTHHYDQAKMDQIWSTPASAPRS